MVVLTEMTPRLPKSGANPTHGIRSRPIKYLAVLAVLGALAACNSKTATETAKPAPHEQGEVLRVGSLVVYQTDLDQQLQQQHAGRSDDATRKKALEQLAARAQFAQAALDAGLDRDPLVRAEIANILASRLRETTLNPRLKELTAAVPQARLRELYQTGEANFRSNEKRQVAVLWLNPNGDPDRAGKYEEKLATARDWLFKNGDLKDHPEQGFAVLSVDYSEHPGSRFKGGVVGWLERQGGMDAWSKALAEIAFSLKEPGDVSTVITRPEGVFLVRFMALKPAVLRPFEAVSGELERAERQRLRETALTEFDGAIKAKYPVQWPPH